MHTASEFLRERAVDHAVAFDSALAFEGVRHDMNAEMRFAARTMAGVAGMQMRLIDNAQALRRERRRKLVMDDCRNSHA